MIGLGCDTNFDEEKYFFFDTMTPLTPTPPEEVGDVNFFDETIFS